MYFENEFGKVEVKNDVVSYQYFGAKITVEPSNNLDKELLNMVLEDYFYQFVEELVEMAGAD